MNLTGGMAVSLFFQGGGGGGGGEGVRGGGENKNYNKDDARLPR